jgi:hypothetical protein
MLYCAVVVCRGALEWSGLSSPGACTTAPLFQCCRVSRKLNEFFGPLLTCGILRALTSAAIETLCLKVHSSERSL